jgi:ATP-dependent RNA helicase SUPV3L1/SUV3
MLRRLRGGAAVVMGALSPRTRNSQVQMYQAGEVDYLVATDAIGMGLNMDVAHVAFASLRKFDGKRSRRLTIPEMAQIAGRAGRHQRDGTFGTLGSEGSGASFDPEEVLAIEGHHFKPLDHLYWRDGTPDFANVGRLIASLEAKPDHRVLRAAPEAIDLAVLKRLAAEPDITHRARGQAMTERLWAACGLPDFRKTGGEAHARLVARVFQHLSEGDRHIPAHWFADEIARLDTVQGDVETIADRIASARTWAYIAHRADWLAEPALWAERTRQLEEKLSDALHERLTQRFVDRRTSVLLRDLDKSGAGMLPVTIGADGEVSVADEPIGHLTGFRFVADANARHADMKRLMAAAERRLGDELGRRAKALVADPDKAFTLATDIGRPVAIFWRGDVVARLGKGRSLAEPRLTLHRTLDPLSADHKAKVIERLERWLSASIARHLAPLAAISAAARNKATAPVLRGLLAPVAEAGGIVSRDSIAAALPALDRDQRRITANLGLKIGTLDLFVPALLKPEPMRWRLALLAARATATMPPVPAPGSAMVGNPDPLLRAAACRAGFRDLGDQMLRVDLVERLARHAHDAREGHRPFVPDPSLSTSLGLKPPAVARLMRALGFAQHKRGGEGEGAAVAWLWRGRRPDRVDAPRSRPGNAFGALARLLPPQAQGAHG